MSKSCWLRADYREVHAGLFLLVGLDLHPKEIAVIGQWVLIEDGFLNLDECAGLAMLHEAAAKLDHCVSFAHLRS